MLKAAEMQPQKDRDELEKRLKEEQPAWEKTMLADGKQAEVRWHFSNRIELFSDHGTKLTKLDDGSVLAQWAVAEGGRLCGDRQCGYR